MSLGLIEACATITAEVRTVKCSPVRLPKVVCTSIYRLKMSLQVCRGLSRMMRRRGRAPVADMACGMTFVLVVDLCPMETPGSCICIFDYAESRGQGRGFDHVPEPA
jgi:hypothetical protein